MGLIALTEKKFTVIAVIVTLILTNSVLASIDVCNGDSAQDKRVASQICKELKESNGGVGIRGIFVKGSVIKVDLEAEWFHYAIEEKLRRNEKQIAESTLAMMIVNVQVASKKEIVTVQIYAKDNKIAECKNKWGDNPVVKLR
jgi:hypothetical protein